MDIDSILFPAFETFGHMLSKERHRGLLAALWGQSEELEGLLCCLEVLRSTPRLLPGSDPAQVTWLHWRSAQQVSCAGLARPVRRSGLVMTAVVALDR